MDHFERMQSEAGGENRLLELVERQVVLPERPVLKPRPKLYQPKLSYAHYLVGDVSPPPSLNRPTLFENSVMSDALLNEAIGDCGDAMVIHGNVAYHICAGTPVPPWQAADAGALYSSVSGYVPGDPNTDTGTDNGQLFKYLQGTGATCSADASKHKIVQWLFVNPQDVNVTKLAIWEFVVMYRAVGLPNTAQGQSTWAVTDPTLKGDAAVGTWGYHDVPEVTYDQGGPLADSWGQPLQATWEFDTAYGVQGIVGVTEEMLDLRGISPAGFNWTKLNADLGALSSVAAS